MSKRSHTYHAKVSDEAIIEMYWRKEERAIQETDFKYDIRQQHRGLGCIMAKSGKGAIAGEIVLRAMLSISARETGFLHEVTSSNEDGSS